MKRAHPHTLICDMGKRWSLLVLLTAAAPQWACSQNSNLLDEDKALKRRFRGLGGGQLRVDATERISTAAIYTEDGYLFNIGRGVFGPNGARYSSYGGMAGGDRLPMPRTLRLMIYPEDSIAIFNPLPFAAREGSPLLDVTVPVASRIPEEVLDGARKGVGGLRLKIRIHPEGLLIGWDLSRGFNLQYLAGGDFREADIENGKVVRKGWYIHPKTGQKIETDF